MLPDKYLDAFSSVSKPYPSLNPRWRSLDQNALSPQNTPALQANKVTLISLDFFAVRFDK